MLTKKSFMWKSKNFYMKLHKIRFLVNPLYSAATHAYETFRTGNWPCKVIFWGMHEILWIAYFSFKSPFLFPSLPQPPMTIAIRPIPKVFTAFPLWDI